MLCHYRGNVEEKMSKQQADFDLPLISPYYIILDINQIGCLLQLEIVVTTSE